MDEQALMMLRERGEDLRYVTQHFQDLQGLGLAPFWAFVLASWLFGFTRSSGRAILATILTSVLVVVISQLWARKWYTHRYGVVIKPASAKSQYTSPWQVLLIVLILGLGIGTMLFRLFDYNNAILPVLVLSVPILLPRCFDRAASSGALLRRMLYAASLAAVLTLSAWSSFGGLGGRWLLANMAGCCLLLSIYDHYLLDRILRSGTRTAENECE